MPIIKWKAAKASQKESENEVPQKRSRRSAEEPGPSHVNKFQCFWCTQFDDEANLRAAGQRWAKTKSNSEHVKTITHKWKKIAAVIKHEHILHSVRHGDVSSNELFYHNPCLTKYSNQYNSFLSTNNIDPTNDTRIKELVLNKTIIYTRDTELAGPGTVFMAGELEDMYVEMLIAMASHGVLMYLDLQSFYFQGFQRYSKGFQATSWACFLILLFKITLKMSRIFLNHW